MRRIADLLFRRAGAIWFLVVVSVSPLAAQPVSNCELGSSQAFLDVNGVVARISNTGAFFSPDIWGEVSYAVPAGSNVNAISSSHLLLVGKVDGELRGSTSESGSRPELWPGPILDGSASDDCSQYDRVFKVSRRDIDVFERTGNATPDLGDWPFDLGAPVVDGDGIEGNYGLESGDRPQVFGDQTLWFISNDLGNKNIGSKTEPLGIEVRGTAFAASSPDSMFNFATFYSFEINNASGLDIEDMFVGMYVDADVGYCCDDFVGSDTALGLAYAYNSDDFDDYPSGYGEAPPAVGYVILEGVSVSDDSMDNDEDGLIDEPDERLGMTNFTTMSIGSERSNLWSTPIRLTVRPHHLPTRRQHSSMLNEGGHCSVSSSGCIPTHRTIARR